MKNFYEATGIRPNLTLDVVLHVKPIGKVRTKLQINDAIWSTEISGDEQTFRHKVGLTDPVDIQIQIDRTHPEALEVELEIEGYKVLPTYQEYAGLDTCYINTNVLWKFNITNFYSWYHEVKGQGWIL
jgi:hypothetical protein